MKKKAYIIPGIKELDMESNLMDAAWSGGGTQQGDPQINPDPDEDPDDNHSRRNVWADESEDYI